MLKEEFKELVTCTLDNISSDVLFRIHSVYPKMVNAIISDYTLSFGGDSYAGKYTISSITTGKSIGIEFGTTSLSIKVSDSAYSFIQNEDINDKFASYLLLLLGDHSIKYNMSFEFSFAQALLQYTSYDIIYAEKLIAAILEKSPDNNFSRLYNDLFTLGDVMDKKYKIMDISIHDGNIHYAINCKGGRTMWCPLV